MFFVSTVAPPTSGADILAVNACVKWTRLVRDSNAGILTATELRAGLKEVQESARLSNNPMLATSSTRALRAVTGGNSREIKTASGEMNVLCGGGG